VVYEKDGKEWPDKGMSLRHLENVLKIQLRFGLVVSMENDEHQM